MRRALSCSVIEPVGKYARARPQAQSEPDKSDGSRVLYFLCKTKYFQRVVINNSLGFVRNSPPPSELTIQWQSRRVMKKTLERLGVWIFCHGSDWRNWGCFMWRSGSEPIGGQQSCWESDKAMASSWQIYIYAKILHVILSSPWANRLPPENINKKMRAL